MGSYDDSYGMVMMGPGPGYVDPAAGYMDPGTGYYQPPYWDYNGQSPVAVTPVSVTLSPQVMVTVLPTTSQPCCDHKPAAAGPTETNNNNIVAGAEATTVCDNKPDPPTMIPLTKSSAKLSSWTAPEDWAEAAEFVPKDGSSSGGDVKTKSWAQVVNTGLTYPGSELSTGQAESLLCPFYKVGECRYVCHLSGQLF